MADRVGSLYMFPHKEKVSETSQGWKWLGNIRTPHIRHTF